MNKSQINNLIVVCAMRRCVAQNAANVTSIKRMSRRRRVKHWLNEKENDDKIKERITKTVYCIWVNRTGKRISWMRSNLNSDWKSWLADRVCARAWICVGDSLILGIQANAKPNTDFWVESPKCVQCVCMCAMVWRRRRRWRYIMLWF